MKLEFYCHHCRNFKKIEQKSDEPCPKGVSICKACSEGRKNRANKLTRKYEYNKAKGYKACKKSYSTITGINTMLSKIGVDEETIRVNPNRE